VFAYTNVEVNRLNAELRQVRRDRGELGGPDVVLVTKHGEAAFATGDRVQFTDTAKKLGIYNGNAGTIIGIEAATGQISVRLDAPTGKTARTVTWLAAEFQGFRHGYAGTIYKGQGKTLDHTYLLHTHHWRAAASYVALTRQRESAQVFVSADTAHDGRQLARQMARGEMRAASVAWATADEIAATQTAKLGQRDEEGQEASDRPSMAARSKEGHAPQADERDAARVFADRAAAAAVSGHPQDAAVQPLEKAPGAGDTPAEGWLITPYADPARQGRDSLGRGTTPGEIAAAVVSDKAVQREHEAHGSYLQVSGCTKCCEFPDSAPLLHSI
jgi:hypothetical protein